MYCFLVGNKSDLPKKPEKPDKPYKRGEVREVMMECSKKFADKNGMPFMELTARNWDKINELFVQLARRLVHMQLAPPEELNFAQEAGDTQDVQESIAMLQTSIVVLDGCQEPKKRKRRCC